MTALSKHLTSAAKHVFDCEITAAAALDYAQTLAVELMSLGFNRVHDGGDWYKDFVKRGSSGLLVMDGAATGTRIIIMSEFRTTPISGYPYTMTSSGLSITINKDGIQCYEGSCEYLFDREVDKKFNPRFLDEPKEYRWTDTGNEALMSDISRWMLNHGDEQIFDKLVPLDQRKGRLPAPRLTAR